MAITKKLIHFNSFSNFSTQKLSANRENTSYTVGVGGTAVAGEPYILFQSIVFIKDVLKIWTHGSLYDCGAADLSAYLTADEIAEVYATIEALNGKQDTIADLETIRSGAAKGATALQSYTEKYTGTYSKPSTGIPKTDLASAVQTSLGKADTALQSYTETDPVFKASAAAGIKSSDITNWNSKTSNTGTVTGVKMNGTTKNPSSGVVDLGTVITAHQDISGKLDSTTAASTYLSKTDAASTYLGKTAKAASATTADSATKATKDGSGNTITSTYATKTALSDLQTQLDTLVSGDASSAIESFNEITAFLEGVEDTGTLDGIIAGINAEIAKKADKSSAITNITRSGTTFTATRADGTTFTFTQKDTTYSSKTAASGGTDVSLVTTGEKYTWNAKQSAISDLAAIRSGASKGATAVQPSSLAAVATSGSYNDLSDKPTIPSAVTESTVSGWGFTKNTGTYSKPSTGIPKTDLASAVQTSLGKADTALQSYTEKYTGTITGITMNGSSKGTSGVVDLGTVITAHQTVKQDGITGATANRYAACSTAAATAAKAASVTSGTFSLEAGARVSVKFANANTAGTPTLNINSKGAKNIFHKGSQITTGSNKSLLAGVVDFIYDGTQWHLVGNYIDTDTTYSSKSAASGGTATSLVTTGEKYTWNSKASTAVASTSANGLMSKSDKSKLDGIASGAEVNVQSDWSVTDTTSDAYIKNKPTIPSAVTESTVSGWGFTKNTGTYSKPSTGIPKTDLASAVQTSLGKADTALQSYTEKYTGTITGIRMNGSSKGTSGVVDLGTVITAHQDISGKQDKLVSGTSIKTINGVSLLGSGNIGMIWTTETNGVEYPSVTIN